jgi:uncharacterized protein YjbJ (UPF0337 family)
MLANVRARALLIVGRRCDVDDQIKGELTKAEGKVKEEFGKVAGDRSTEIGGKVDQLKGTLQQKAGEIESAAEREQREQIDDRAAR